MASTSTYQKIWERYDELRKSYNILIDEAFHDGSTLAQYAGSERLAKLVSDIESLLDDCSKLKNERDRRNAESAVIAMLYSAKEALADAYLFECDPAADFDEFVSSRPCPLPIIS